MRGHKASFWRSQILFCLYFSLLASVASGQTENIVPASTPAGIMLVEVHREEGASSDQYFWTRLGDSNGNSLFYFTGNNLLTHQFKPFVADESAVAFGDWSLMPNQGMTQWAYQSNPLYTWSLKEDPGQIALNVALYGSGPSGEAPLAENTRGALMPPKGWQVSRFMPINGVHLPDGIELHLIDSGQGTVLTNFEGFSLYGFFGESAASNTCMDFVCNNQWVPMSAPALANEIGDFSIIERADGTRQWVFRGEPLFRFKGDLLPGDTHGRENNEYMQLALVTKNFTPEGIEVVSQPGYGDVFVLNGKTLYFGSAFEKYWGGRNLRGSFEITYVKGKRLGGDACVNDKCLAIWQPFFAPTESKSTGFWEVITRADGGKQWAYKGFALYTNRDDKAAGQMHGHSIYDIADVDGDEFAIARIKHLAEVGNALGGAGIYWSVAKP